MGLIDSLKQYASVPATALAPMQDVTTLGFFRIMARYGAPDYFVTEFFRVHATSTLEKDTLASITQNDTGRPVFAQLIGEDIPHMVRAAKELLEYPVAGIDLNLGCPAPKVYKKNVGGGLLRDIRKTDTLLGALREATAGKIFTVKMRIGFDSREQLPAFLDLIKKHEIDLLAVHGRTVKGLYRSAVDYDAIALAAAGVPCPVIANGDITSAAKAEKILKQTGCAGVMLGRHAIRNPWVFRQIREHFSGAPIFQPTLADVRGYVDALDENLCDAAMSPERRASRLKKFLNFVGTGVDADGAFLSAMRCAPDLPELLRVCDEHLIAGDRAEILYPEEPYAGVVARPNCEV